MLGGSPRLLFAAQFAFAATLRSIAPPLLEEASGGRSRDTPAARLQSQQTSHAVASPDGERRGGDSIDLAHRRLVSQQLAVHASTTPAEIVAALGAVQAQDYAGGKWAIALRLPHATDEDIEHAIVDRTIVRTWPMRGTLHFVAAAEVRWLLDLLAPRMIARAATRHRQLELDDATFSRARRVVTKALEGGGQLTRDALYQALEEAHVPVGPHATGERRGFHILWRLAHERLICFGPRGGKQQTLVLLDEWLGPPPPPLSRDEMLAMLAERYFTAHGPATVADFTWWSSLAAAEARRALDIDQAALPVRSARRRHLLVRESDATVALPSCRSPPVAAVR